MKLKLINLDILPQQVLFGNCMPTSTSKRHKLPKSCPQKVAQFRNWIVPSTRHRLKFIIEGDNFFSVLLWTWFILVLPLFLFEASPGVSLNTCHYQFVMLQFTWLKWANCTNWKKNYLIQPSFAAFQTLPPRPLSQFVISRVLVIYYKQAWNQDQILKLVAFLLQ